MIFARILHKIHFCNVFYFYKNDSLKKAKENNTIFTQQILKSKKHTIYKTPKTQFVSCLFLCDV